MAAGVVGPDEAGHGAYAGVQGHRLLTGTGVMVKIVQGFVAPLQDICRIE